LKCDPEYAIDLREKHPAIIPGYHMNKKHWNTVILDGSLPDPFIMKLIDDSYKLVVDKLPKKDRELLKNL
jgi:predicted DNA-binding protein (MmcQ/YjbR family)